MSVRRSKQSALIMRVLKETSSHPSADWLYTEVRKEMPTISLGTIYRNLRLLKERGEILELDFGDCSRFDGRPNNHYHFKCEKCGHILDVGLPLHKDLDQEVAEKTGFVIWYHRLEFRGLCKVCQ